MRWRTRLGLLLCDRIRQRPWHQSTDSTNIRAEQGSSAWQSFERLCAGDLQQLPIEPPRFYLAPCSPWARQPGFSHAGDYALALMDNQGKLDDDVVLLLDDRKLWSHRCP